MRDIILHILVIATYSGLASLARPLAQSCSRIALVAHDSLIRKESAGEIHIKSLIELHLRRGETSSEFWSVVGKANNMSIVLPELQGSWDVPTTAVKTKKGQTRDIDWVH